MLLGGMLVACNNKQTTNNDMKQELELTQEWDKVFPLSEKVNHKKVTFKTQYGLTLAADLYMPVASEKEKRKVKSCLPSPSPVLSEPLRSSVADSMP